MAIALPLSPVRGLAALSRRLRAAIAWLHLWVGLGVGSVFAVIGLSGSVLVFHEDLLRWQHPQLAAQTAHVDGAVLARLLEREGPQGLRSLQLPNEHLPVWTGFYADRHRAYFSPGDGALLLTRSHDDDPLLWLHYLHTHLLAGKPGEEVLGVIGWISLGLLLTGLYLWWPKRGRMLAQLKVHRGPPVRRWLTWHRSSGVLLLPLLLLATLTGVGMIYREAAELVLGDLFGAAAHQDPPTRPLQGPVDWPRVLERAQAALPGARLSRVAVPKDGNAVISIRLRSTGEWHPYGRSTVDLDTGTGDALRVRDATAEPLGTRMNYAIYPLHVGAVGGEPMRWLTALAGVLPAFLLTTGFLFWRRRRARSGLPAPRP